VQFKDNPVFAMLFLEAVAICLLISFRFINLESTVNLLWFNLLFVSMTFILKAPLNRKLGLLALGNVIGVFCNFYYRLFHSAGCLIFGDPFSLVYVILYPFFNFMWIVTFWSLSLAALSSQAKGRR